MNLAQYRLKAVVTQRNRLRVCLAAAGILHGVAIVLLHPWVRYSTSSAPIQFIVIDQPNSLSTSSTIISSANSSVRPQTTPQIALPFTGITRSRTSLSAPQTKPPAPVISTPQSAVAKDEIWGAYLATLRRQIYQRWQAAPPVKRDRPTKVRFIIDRQGYLTDLVLVESSRDATADQDAIRAVRAAVPFAPLPIASKEDRLRVTFTFETPVLRK